MSPCPPHHWLIKAPTGPTSRGKCKRCRAVKVFRNYADWELNLGNWATMPMKKGDTTWLLSAK